MRAQEISGVLDRSTVKMQVALRGAQRSVPGDLPQDVKRYASVSHPRETGMPKIMASEMFEAELRDDLVPVRRIAQHRGRHPPAARASEQSGHRVINNPTRSLLPALWAMLYATAAGGRIVGSELHAASLVELCQTTDRQMGRHPTKANRASVEVDGDVRRSAVLATVARGRKFRVLAPTAARATNENYRAISNTRP